MPPNPSPWRIPVVLLLALATAGCPGETPEREPESDPGRAGTPSAGALTVSEREAFYHLAEGSEVFPMNLARALRSTATGRPFFERPERFGLIADPQSPYGLPVGATGDYTVDTRFLGIRMLGFNCSACHVNEISYQGNRIRVDGGPSRFYPDSLAAELQAAGRRTLHSWPVFWQYLKDLYAIEHGREPTVASREPAHLRSYAQPQVQGLLARLDDADTTAAERAFVAAARRALSEDSARYPAVNLWEVSWDTTHPANRQIRERYRDAGALAGARAALARLTPGHRQELASASGAAPEAAQESIAGTIRDWILVARLLRDRLESFRPAPTKGPVTPNGIGRVDAFGVARNKIYPDDQVPETAPVSFPHLWGFPLTVWLHYDANTNSVMERNLGQALGVGAIWDRRTLQSTLNPRNIHQLEQIARKIPTPAWPASFPAVDRAKADRGRPIFGAQCAGCHMDRPRGDLCYRLASVGTDSLRPINFALPLNRGTFTSAVAPVLRGLKTQAYRTFNVPADSQEIMDGIPDSAVVWRTTRQWGARPLAGIWATAPFLHNGSVPSLYELLLPPERRSKTFPLGHAEYDPARLGYVMNPAQVIWTFDTSRPGNGNGGHAYGTQLSEEERMALLEYLKGFTEYGDTVTRHPDAVQCDSLAI